VAEILIESEPLTQGDTIMIVGPTTGVVELQPNEIRVHDQAVAQAVKGDYCSIRIEEDAHAASETAPASRVRRGDKVYIWKKIR
jgi:putative protease